LSHYFVVSEDKKNSGSGAGHFVFLSFLVAVCEGHGQVMQLLHSVLKLVDHKKSYHAVLIGVEEGYLELLVAAIGADLNSYVVVVYVCYCYWV
jgi:hypothetical protein